MTVGCSLAFGSFAYQAFGAQDWDAAIMRAWFQLSSCITVGVVDWWLRRTVGGA
jgi:hypothetical protein